MTIMRFLIVVGVGVLGACSSLPYAQRQAERLAAYTAAAGAPVSNFRFFTLYSWEPLSDSALAVYTRPNRAWLLDVDGGCHNLAFTQSIGLTSNLNQVWVRFDKVLTGRRDFPCTITQIRPVDLKQLKATEQEQRQIRAQPRTVEPTSAG
jgi:hypothetical protein